MAIQCHTRCSSTSIGHSGLDEANLTSRDHGGTLPTQTAAVARGESQSDATSWTAQSHLNAGGGGVGRSLGDLEVMVRALRLQLAQEGLSGRSL